MALIETALSSDEAAAFGRRPVLSLLCLTLSYLVVRSLYRIFFHPLRQVPGPLRCKVSSLWLAWTNYRGDHHLAVHALHRWRRRR